MNTQPNIGGLYHPHKIIHRCAYNAETEQNEYVYMDVPGGWTVRDEFASKAMQALFADKYCDRSKAHTQRDIAAIAYSMADAMLKARAGQ